MDQPFKTEVIFDENKQMVDFFNASQTQHLLGDDFISQIKPFSQELTFQGNDIILSEGQMNDNIYFLLSGTVSIWVGGERIAQIDRKGDIVGEMSIIRQTPCSATVQAENTVTMICVSVAKMKEPQRKNADAQQLALYKIFAKVLSTKLAVTNQKAKQFEVVNRDLLQAQIELKDINENLELKVKERTIELTEQNAALLTTSENLIDQVSTKEKLLDKLMTIKNFTIANLEAEINQVGASELSNLEQIIPRLRNQVEKLKDSFQPFTSLTTSGIAIKRKKVLLAESNRKQQIIANMALKGTGVELDVVSSESDGYLKLDQHSYDMICFNTEFIELAVKAYNLNKQVKTVLMTSEKSSEYYQKLMQYPFLSNIVTRAEDDQAFISKNITTTVSKLISGDYFGLEKYLGWGVEVQEVQLTDSQLRASQLEDLETYLVNLGIKQKLIHRAVTVAEETAMNAIYDAPVDQDGIALYNHLERTVRVQLQPKQQGVLRYACDGIFLAISTEDPFGAFKREIILDYLGYGYSNDLDSIAINERLGKGGAGKGIYQILSLSDLVIFNVKAGVKTEVITLFDLNPNKIRIKGVPSFHYFIC